MKYTKEHLVGLPYMLNAGPLPEDVLRNLDGELVDTNCQRAVQIFYKRVFDIVLPTEVSLSAEGYRQNGIVIIDSFDREDPSLFFKVLQFGDFIYSVPKNSKIDPSTEDGQKRLHIGIFTQKKDHKFVREFYKQMGLPDEDYVFHATHIARGTTFWKPQAFIERYTPLRARRILSLI